ncbi:hypothetical protein [Aminipila terrae]|uniref:DUF4430 domain-containing protein n=1 Tax=Aminipila terrae TaxID=2697030 RepID=A0A6P1MK43_9FIRM|nr:hypothetical protein [Aminipila terrae]QHI71385.1 hypothetical protein Ami3637_02390 [Aminipila terrae]
MKKLLNKRIFAVALALVMVFAMASVSFAAEKTNGTVHVNIYVQEVDRMGTSPVQTVLTTTPIQVTVQSGQSVKDAINKAVAEKSGLLTTAEWTGNFLKSATYDGVNYINEDSYSYDETTHENVYDGLSWMYFVNTPDNMPQSTNDYPTVSMGEKLLTSDASVTLSFEALEYRWK